jgi:hypothetical protein
VETETLAVHVGAVVDAGLGHERPLVAGELGDELQRRPRLDHGHDRRGGRAAHVELALGRTLDDEVGVGQLLELAGVALLLLDAIEGLEQEGLQDARRPHGEGELDGLAAGGGVVASATVVIPAAGEHAPQQHHRHHRRSQT